MGDYVTQTFQESWEKCLVMLISLDISNIIIIMNFILFKRFLYLVVSVKKQSSSVWFEIIVLKVHLQNNSLM